MGSTFELRQQIARLNRLDMAQAAYPALVKTTRHLTEGMQTVVGMTGGGEMFFRARTGLQSKPVHCDDVSAPPASAITGYQRCNPPNLPMFYAASRRSTALVESGVAIGQKVYLSQWIGKKQLPINRIFDASLEENWRTPLSDHSHILHSYLETLFTRRIHASFSDEYKLTAAIAQQLTNGFSEGGEHDVHADRTVALRYPSVVDIENSYNTAMHRAFARERLSLVHVMELTVDQIIGNRVSCSITDNAFKIENDEIVWSGDAQAFPARRPNGDAPFIFKENKWRLLLATDPGEAWSAEDMIGENKPKSCPEAASQGE